MPHTPPQPSGTLTAGRSVVGATASARTPDQSPDQSGVTAFWDLSQPITTDTAGKRYLTLKDRHTSGPRNIFEWVITNSRATGLAKQCLLNLAWPDEVDFDHPTWPGYLHLWLHLADEDLAAAGLRVTEFTEADLDPVVEAVLELIALGELLLINPSEDPVPVASDALDTDPVFPSTVDLSRECPSVRYTLPAYQQWMTRTEVAW